MNAKSELTRASHAELTDMLQAPDLTRKERRELTRAARFQKRVELWEERRANPSPRKFHRAAATILMMGACIWLLWFINGGGSY